MVDSIELEERIVTTELSSSNHRIILVHGLLGMSHGIKKLNLPKETSLKLFQKMRGGIGVGVVKEIKKCGVVNVRNLN